MIKHILISFWSVVLLAHSPAAHADTERLLKWFDQDPRAFMARQSSGRPAPETADLIEPAALKAKNKIRDQILRAAKWQAPHAGSGVRESLEDLIDPHDLDVTRGRIVKVPSELDALGLNRSTLTNDVWSGPAWSMYRGLTAQRYALPLARNAASWKDAWSFASAPGHAFADIAMGLSRDIAIDDLGPAEKYDLLIGTSFINKTGFLSSHEWDQGRRFQDTVGTVEKWYGYCHGWAAAAFMVPRPRAVVSALAADGKTIVRFYPADLKGLTTALWANELPDSRVIGHRCDVSKPARDPNGRVIDENCFDVNPALFHLAVVHQIGSAHRNLIIDATYDLQIWNQPIQSYRYRYFNPQTKKAGDFAQSVVAIDAFTNDKFRRYRSPAARQIVGVSLDLTYAHGTAPDHRRADTTAGDDSRNVNYLYDLELDAHGEIIGGEWYQLRHPDFLWAPAKGARAMSYAERAAQINWPAWNPSQSVPLRWRGVAVQAAASGAPLLHILDVLIAQSQDVSN